MIKEELLNIKDGDWIAFSSAYKFKHFLKKAGRYLIHWISYLESAKGTEYDDVPEHIAIFYRGDVYERMILGKGIVKTPLIERLKNSEKQIEIRHFPLRKKLNATEAGKLGFFLRKELKMKEKYGFFQAFYTVLDKLPFMKYVKISEKAKGCSKFVFQAAKATGRIASYYDANKYTPIEALNFAKSNGVRLLKANYNRIDK